MESSAKKDLLFASPQARSADFQFDQRTADVFEDMLSRSVPFYDEVQRMMAELVKHFAQPGGAVYDLGCSVGRTLATLAQAIPSPDVRLVGVDLSEPMIQKAKANLQEAGCLDRCELKIADLNALQQLDDACAVIMCLTLQFVRPLSRDAVLQTIYNSLSDRGCLILVEKILGNNSLFNRLLIDLYYAFKRRQGYSELEIGQKREALENVLIPYRLDENIQLLRKVGFESIEVFFKWYNFAGIIAVKG
ncbi:MAG TPA: carboxy-S-adenosyl-L-methionine synthase CmoA [Candidatus Omnitrophica bacterium]|nr:carboxy-S-adenosyl-L-methionine synthase CmoA [Candidatus Omnitrophota bacterium]